VSLLSFYRNEEEASKKGGLEMRIALLLELERRIQARKMIADLHPKHYYNNTFEGGRSKGLGEALTILDKLIEEQKTKSAKKEDGAK
jgi:hypothetical protein